MSFTEPYDPVTGEGSDVIPRKEIKIEEFGTLHIPADMYEENGWVQILAQEKSYKNLLENHLHQRATPQLVREIDRQFFLLRIKYDFEFWAIATVTIKDKMTSVDIPFLLNKSQRKLLKLFEQQRRAGKPIRVILLKSRQWGGSTLTQIYMAWIQLVHKHQWNSVIAAHHKDSSLNIKAMYTKLLDNYPAWILNSPLKFKPFERTQNVYYIPQVSARVTIGSAEKPNSVRGSDIAMAHFSEVALYEDTPKKRTADLIASICSSIPMVPYSVIVMESTAQGVGDYFHTEYTNAKDGKSDKMPLFIPWYDIEMYQTPVDDYKQLISSFTDYERYLWKLGATLEGIAWYRDMRKTYQMEQQMKSEFPSDDVEAFANSGERVFDAYAVERMRENVKKPVWLGELQSATHAITGEDALRELSFKEDTTGLLKIWEKPDTELNVSNRYIVSVDVCKGHTKSADWSVISVIDRYWTIYGGKPEAVASWRGRVDKDILAWKSAQIAMWYNEALLIFESNTYETSQGDTEYILDQIADSYENLYARQSPPSQIKEGDPARWGFHTNRTTKPIIINNQIQLVRDNAYIEREKEALDEHDTYVVTEKGYEAKDGCHDDLLMSRAIGLYISGSIDPPKLVNKIVIRHKKPVSEASF